MATSIKTLNSKNNVVEFPKIESGKKNLVTEDGGDYTASLSTAFTVLRKSYSTLTSNKGHRAVAARRKAAVPCYCIRDNWSPLWPAVSGRLRGVLL